MPVVKIITEARPSLSAVLSFAKIFKKFYFSINQYRKKIALKENHVSLLKIVLNSSHLPNK